MAAPPPLVGQVLGHYRIIEQIGAGGMGVVYRAHDEQLERDVAIKVLPTGMLADDATHKRFRKEALSLAKLSHPNIATIHEFGSQGEVDFLVTEYIPGVTLDSKLALGALPPEQVIQLGIQLAEGLSAAHQHGVVHRDLKPGNLRLTPDGRLKILDFGLAQLAPHSSETELTVTLTKSQEVSGTLPYMSPEQLRGGVSDARTDIWGAGAVLYEIATAHRPFEEKVPTALAGDIIYKAPLPPRKLRLELSQNVEAVILKCLEKDPAKRYQSARELLSDMERLSTGSTPVVARRRWLWPAVVSAISLVIGASAFWYGVAHKNGANSSSIHTRPSVAVLGFTNVSGALDASWISTALAEMLTTELGAGEHLRTIPGENVARTKLDLSLPDTDSYGRDTLARIRKHLGADYVILGSYFETTNAPGGQMRLDLRLQDARAGETIATLSEVGSEAQLLDLVSRTGSELRRKLGVADVSPRDAGAIRASIPSDPETARLYSEGLKKLRAFDALGARDVLEKAVAHEPGFPLAHSALAEVWSRLGYDKKAKEQAKKASDLSTNLSREERLSVEARYRDLNHERDKAIELYRTLFDSAPDNLEYGLQLAITLQRSGKGKDALNTVEFLRHMAPPARDDPRIDLAEAYGAESLGDFKRAQAAAVTAGERAQAVGAPLLVAAAQLEQCRIFRNRGQYQDARVACENAKNAYSTAGDREELAMALLAIGATSYEQGDLAEAQKADEQALGVFREVGRQSAMASTLSELANVLSIRGEHAGAEARYNQALASYREIESKGNVATEIHNVASELKLQGKLDDASARFHESLTLNRELGQEDVASMDLANLGSALYLQGKLDESARVLDEALVICRRIDFKQACGVALSSQGDLLVGRGRLDEARKKYDEALAIRKDMGAAIDSAETQVSIAELALEQGRPGDAEAAVREPAEVFRQEQMTEDQTWATVVLAKALLAQGKYLDARKELDAINTLGARIQNEEVRLKLTLATLSARAASSTSSDRNAAGHSLDTMLGEARKHGFVGYELEARLALGKIEMRSAQTATAGIARLTDLEKDARARGFLLIARKAVAAKAPLWCRRANRLQCGTTVHNPCRCRCYRA